MIDRFEFLATLIQALTLIFGFRFSGDWKRERREELRLEDIYEITPVDTPLIFMIGEGAITVRHEWIVR